MPHLMLWRAAAGCDQCISGKPLPVSTHMLIQNVRISNAID